MTIVSHSEVLQQSVNAADARKPYDYICEHQDDKCELSFQRVHELMFLCNQIPAALFPDIGVNGLCLRYVTRVENGKFLFVEIAQISKDRYFVTSMIEGLEAVADYVPDLLTL